MDGQEAQRVKQFLYSIRTTEFAIGNLERAIEDIETRHESPPTWSPHLDTAGVSGGSGASKLETWTEFLVDTYDARRSFLADSLAQHKRKVQQYEDTLLAMVGERWGHLGAEIVRLKYHKRVRPDSAIYCYHLFCAERTFYQAHNRALQFFYEAMPDRFGRKAA
jgi:hypothetical protein